MAKKTIKTGGEALPAQPCLPLDDGSAIEAVQATQATPAVHEVHPARSKQPRPWNAQDYHISQSTYKQYLKYRRGQSCGIAFLEEYILRNPLFNQDEDETAAQYLGKYFEYMVSGYHDNEQPPQPEVYKVSSAGKYAKGDPKPEFKLADEHARIFKDALANMGLEIIEAGRYMRDPVHKVSLLLDVVVHLPEADKPIWEVLIGGWFNQHGSRIRFAEYPSYDQCGWTTESGKQYHGGCFIIDLKMSGLLNDKWHEMGWHPDFVDQRSYHGIQAHTYEGVTGLPFFFYVASPKELDVRFLRSITNPERTKKHLANMDAARKEIVRGMAIPGWFKAYPTLGRCSQCPLNAGCEFAAKAPTWVGVDFQIDEDGT